MNYGNFPFNSSGYAALNTLRSLNQLLGLYSPDLFLSKRNVTGDAANDQLDAVAHGLVNGNAIRLVTTGVLPAPLSPNTVYYVVGAAANDFQVSLTPGGAAIDITDAGTGTHAAILSRTAVGYEPFRLGGVASADVLSLPAKIPFALRLSEQTIR